MMTVKHNIWQKEIDNAEDVFSVTLEEISNRTYYSFDVIIEFEDGNCYKLLSVRENNWYHNGVKQKPTYTLFTMEGLIEREDQTVNLYFY